MEVRTTTGEKFVLERAINRGGEAQIWTVGHDPHLVAKLYHKPTAEHKQKLTTMIATPLPRVGSHPSVAWPLQLLYRQNTFVGYLMPRAAGSLPLFHFYNPARRQRLGLPHAWPRFLHRTATNLAAAVELVHAHDHVVGDLNESNVLVTQSALVTLVDTDSFQIRNQITTPTLIQSWLGSPQPLALYRCGVGKAEYTPPELQGVDFKSIDRTPEHDNFALGVLVFYLVMGGFHPFAGVLTANEPAAGSVGRIDLYAIRRGLFPYIQWGANAQQRLQPPPNAPAFAHLHPGLQDAFRRTFSEGHTQPERRVNAKEWKQLLHEAEEALVTCPNDAHHLYSRHLRGCPICTPVASRQSRARQVDSGQLDSEKSVSGQSVSGQEGKKGVGARLAGVWRGVAQRLGVDGVLSGWLAAMVSFNLWLSLTQRTPQIKEQVKQALYNYAKIIQSTVLGLPGQVVVAKRIAVTHSALLGRWCAGNLIGMVAATGAMVGSYFLLPQLDPMVVLVPQTQAMLIATLFALLLGTSQRYGLGQSLLPSPYLRYGWVVITAATGTGVGAAGYWLLGSDWHQVETWPDHALTFTLLAMLFGITLGFLQSFLLRQRLQLADDGRAWTLANGISGILTAQGWLWGRALPYSWQLASMPDWQINAGMGALVGSAIGTLITGSVLLWMVQGLRRNLDFRHVALGLWRQPSRPIHLRHSAVRWVHAFLLLILFWCFLQVVSPLN
jgi:serine/threonine protein kinase